MPALTINGITIPVRGDSFSEERIQVGDSFQRTIGGAMFSSRINSRRKFRFSTTPQDATTAERLTLLLEGNAQAWTFNYDLSSMSGITNYTATGAALSTSPASRDGTKNLGVPSATGFEVNLQNKFASLGQSGFAPTTNDGWTACFWRYCTIAADGVPSNGWYHFIAGASITRGSAANPVALTQYRNGVVGSYGLGYVLSMTGIGVFGIWGYQTIANVGSASNYDDLVVFPFTFTAAMALQFYTAANVFVSPLFPALVVGGDHINKSAGGTDYVTCYGRVDSINHINATIPGSTSKPNVKILEVTLEER
jgi:hypothetical protein